MIACSRALLRPLLAGVADAVSELMLTLQFDKPFLSIIAVVQVKSNLYERDFVHLCVIVFCFLAVSERVVAGQRCTQTYVVAR
jgi:hypothetical protein